MKANELHGIIQGRVVAGIARVQNNQLYGYLTSDKKCRFSVFIGETKAPGIAFGYEQNEMRIKFIPKWHHIKEGDKVVTSGLDNIFFANIPVGIVTKIEVQSSYTVAHIKTYSDIFHPKTFFLITDAKATLTENFDSNKTNIVLPQTSAIDTIDMNDTNNSTSMTMSTTDLNHTMPVVSSIPSRIDQTQDDLIEPETIEEQHVAPKPKIRIKKRKSKSSSSHLDLF